MAGDALQAQRGIIPESAVSIRVVVDDLSVQHFGGHNVVAQELERASTCMADNAHASRVRESNKEVQGPRQLGLRADKAAGAAAAPWCASDEDRTKPRNRFRIREASGQSGATGTAGEL